MHGIYYFIDKTKDILAELLAGLEKYWLVKSSK